MTTPATLKVTTGNNTNETRIDQLNNKLKTFQQMLVQDADDLKHKNSDGDIREPKDNPKVYINSLRDMRNRINQAMEWAKELEELQNRSK